MSGDTISVDRALRDAKTLGLDRLDAQLLLAHVLGQSRSWLLAHDDELLDAGRHAAWRSLCDRRLAGEPVAYLVGTKEFHGLLLHVDERVLVPRPETEMLVEWALQLLSNVESVLPQVVDLGTGSGAIALAVKWSCPAAQVIATDADPEALAVAQANATRLGLAIEMRLGDWWAALLGERVDLALANPPYIAGGDAHLAALVHEPRHALTPGGDGLGALKRIAEGAAAHLRPGGWLLLEHSHDQAEAVHALLAGHGFEAIQTRADLAGHPRCTGGHRAASAPA